MRGVPHPGPHLIACVDCPLRGGCTSAAAGRTISISPYEVHLAAGRARQANPVWKADYRATRPKVERKIGHLMRRRHGEGEGEPSDGVTVHCRQRNSNGVLWDYLTDRTTGKKGWSIDSLVGYPHTPAKC